MLFPKQSIISLPLLFPLELASLPANSIVKITSSFRPLSFHQPGETPSECLGALFYATFILHTQLLSYIRAICELVLSHILDCNS